MKTILLATIIATMSGADIEDLVMTNAQRAYEANRANAQRAYEANRASLFSACILLADSLPRHPHDRPTDIIGDCAIQTYYTEDEQ